VFKDLDTYFKVKEAYKKEYIFNPLDFRYLTRNEIEELQTVPKDYTAAATYRQSIDLLGDGWTIDVISHIFKYMNF